MRLNIYPMLKYLEGLSMLNLFFIVVFLPTGMVVLNIVTSKHEGTDYTVTHEVFFDIEIAGEFKGQIVIGLFGDIAPKTVQNFYTLATTGVGGEGYQGTVFHRVIKKFMIQGGDVKNASGLGRVSIYGETFDDENFDVKHKTLGFVAMANSGKDSNGCQFYINTRATPWLDDKHVVFGKVIDGQGHVHLIEHLDTDSNDRPLQEVRIAKSGSRNVRRPYTITDDPYNMADWLKTISIPLLLSFTIIYIFNYFIKQLDKGIETEETLNLMKKDQLARAVKGRDVEADLRGGKGLLRKRDVGGGFADSDEDLDRQMEEYKRNKAAATKEANDKLLVSGKNKTQ